MEKIQFTYQKWFLKIFTSGITFAVAIPLQCFAAKLMGIEYANFVYLLICSIIAYAAMAFYYVCAQKHRWFVKQGNYWVKDGIVYIQRQNKVYELKNVEWLRGTTVSAYGLSKSGMLVVQCEKKKIVFVSFSTKQVDNFSKCELLPLFETILDYNPALQKDDTLDFWYEIKK